MEKKIFLLKNKGNGVTNENSYLDINLSTKKKMMVSADLEETLNLYDLYNTERDNCNKFRLILDINPICTNVLFNNVTEIVKKEGSPECERIIGNEYIKNNETNNAINTEMCTKGVNRLLAIQDTELSINDTYEYHPGKDIFNNHMLRFNGFPFIGLNSDSGYCANYNTIRDIQRDCSGNVIKGINQSKTVIENVNDQEPLHVYDTDNIDSLTKSFRIRCEEKDGWFGFINRSTIDIPNALYKRMPKKTLNKVINNKNSCEFIDMYPDRSLYSFTPKYNKYRNRYEKNWDYCLTYPYENDYDKIEELNDNNGFRAIKIIECKVVYSNDGSELIQFKPLFKHTLNVGSEISLYIKGDDDNIAKLVNGPIFVSKVGDSEGYNTDTIFKINFESISDSFVIVNGELKLYNGGNFKNVSFFYKKKIDGVECDYYFRKFRKIGEIRSEINDLSFAKNIYGDNITQIVFTDDIDVTGLKDNIGRPVSTLYFTTIKRNAGHDIWYSNKQTSLSADTIEFSHAFGEVTSGIELPNTYSDYNIHKIHSIPEDDIATNWRKSIGDYAKGTEKYLSNFRTQPKTIEKDITIESNDFFYGDIVEFDFTTLSERRINTVYHRFNTAQREALNRELCDLYEDVVVADDYNNNIFESYNRLSLQDKVSDLYEQKEINDKEFNGTFVTGRDGISSGNINNFNNLLINQITGTTQNDFVVTEKRNVLLQSLSGDDIEYAVNIEPEGYYYNPHYAINIHSFSNEIIKTNPIIVNTISGSEMTLSSMTVEYSDGTSGECATITFECDTNKFIDNDRIIFYDVLERCCIFGNIYSIDDNKYTVLIEYNEEYIPKKTDGKLNSPRLMVLYTNINCPVYAKYITSDNSIAWKNMLKTSEIPYGSELYDLPFSNGAFYLHKSINFYLNRQDGSGEYYMLEPEKDKINKIDVVPKFMATLRIPKLPKLIMDAIKYIESFEKNDCL